MKNYAFSRSSRLTEKGSFNKVFAKPVFVKKTPFMSVLVCVSDKLGARLGIVVAKKNVKLAVDRNKLKRFVRESFRQQQQQLCGLDLVVLIKKDFVSSDGSLVNLSGILKMAGDKHAVCCKN